MAHPEPPAQDPRAALRRLYAPWCWLVFIPYLTLSTLFWGTMALLTSRISRRLSFHCGTAWAWLLCRVNWTWVRVEGREHVRRGQSYVIMSNHQSHFDVLAFYGHWGWQFRWVMKQELRNVPGLGWGCAGVGHIFIDRSNRERAIASLNASRHLLSGGVSIMFFPEGTRSSDGQLLPFKKGGFVMAQDLELPILPVTIKGSGQVLPNRTLALLPGLIRIQIHPPVEVIGHSHEEIERLIEQVRAAIASGL